MRIFLLYILNGFDAIVTYWVLTKFGSEMELNPLMQAAFEAGLFLPLKFGVMAILCYVLWKHFREANKTINFLLGLYGLLAIYHIVNLTLFLN